MTTEVVKEEQVTLKDGSDTSSLAAKLETPHLVFTGHPASSGEPFELPESPESPESPEAPEPPKPEKEPKYKSLEEAEKGAAEHQRFATEKAEEAARLRDENEALKKRLESPPEPPEPPRPPAKSAEEIQAESAARIESALEEIGQLDEYDPEYRKKVASAWAKAGFGGMPAGQLEIPDEIFEQRVQKILDAREKVNEEVNVRSKANTLAAEAGLDMSDEDADDYVLFWHHARKAPDAPFQEQVQWTINEVKRRRGGPPPVTDHEKKRVETEQIHNAPLERGGPGPPQAPPTSPSTRSLNTILEENRQSRII